MMVEPAHQSRIGQTLLDLSVMFQLCVIGLRCDEGYDEGISFGRFSYLTDDDAIAGIIQHPKVVDNLTRIGNLAVCAYLKTQDFFGSRYLGRAVHGLDENE